MKRQEPNKSIVRNRTTLQDIADAVGVSANTVSCVLNPRSKPVRVAPHTRRAVLEAARKMNYHRNVAASRLAGGKTRTIGILLPNLIHAFYGPVADAFEQEVIRLGYQCLIGCARYNALCNTKCIENFLIHDVNGVMLTAFWDDPDVKEALNLIFERALPTVFIDFQWDEHPAPIICGNHFQGGQLLARHLLAVGHRTLLYLAPDNEITQYSVCQRIAGIRAVLNENKMPVQAMAEEAVPMAMTDYATKKQIIDAAMRAIESAHPPSVIVCDNDAVAYRVMQGLIERGVQIPRDIAVTGYDDLNSAYLQTLGIMDYIPFALPTLTTVRQPLREIGQEAARILVQQIEHEPIQELQWHALDVSLVVRESSRLPDRFAKNTIPLTRM